VEVGWLWLRLGLACLCYSNFEGSGYGCREIAGGCAGRGKRRRSLFSLNGWTWTWTPTSASDSVGFPLPLNSTFRLDRGRRQAFHHVEEDPRPPRGEPR